MDDLKKGLYIVSTPIGNLDDISIRAKNILSLSDFIICENPKHSIKLLNKLGIKKKLFPLHDYNEFSLIRRVDKYKDNSVIALISDAGSPLVSDPGYNLVKNYIKNDIFVTSIPGPSSVITSLQLSGLPSNNFIFFGFVPKNKGALSKMATGALTLDFTSIFFISANRLLFFLQEIMGISQDVDVALCKELTKINELIFRGNIKTIIKKIEDKQINLKGEFTLVINNSKLQSNKTIDDNIRKQTKKLLKKYTLTETVEIVHKLSNISKKEIYRMSLKMINE